MPCGAYILIMPAMNVVLCYDLSDDRERGRVERVAERYGVRIQKSVFWCPLANLAQRNALEEALRGLNGVSGSVLLIPASAWNAVAGFGDSVATKPGEEVFVAL